MAQAKMFPTTSFDAQNEDLVRQQKILDALQNRTLMPTELPAEGRSGNFTVAAKLDPLQGTAQLLQALLLNKRNEELGEKKSEFQRQGNEMLQGDLGKYWEASQTDQKKALLDALASEHPVMRGLAMAQLEAQAKKGERAVGEINGILYDKNTLETLNLKPSAVTGDGGLPGVVDGQSGPGWKTVKIGGDLYQQTGAGLKKLDNAPKVTTNVSVSPIIKGEGKFMEGIGEASAKAVAEANARKKAAQQNRLTADKLENLDSQGVFSGPTANIATTLSSFANTFGIPVDTNKLASSETYQAELGRRVAEVLTAGAGVGRSMTDADREAFMKQFPQLISSPQGRAQIIGEMRQNAEYDSKYADAVQAKIKQAYPEASNLLDITPSELPFPTEGYTPAPTQGTKKKKYNPATGRIE